MDLKKKPLVTIICLCYNQKRYVVETLDSAVLQSYQNLELIIVDDGSDDGSPSVINQWLKSHQEIKFLPLSINVGNTTAFNKGLELANGKYIIDLSCDDIMLPTRVEKQVSFFESQPDQIGVIYHNVQYINGEGKSLNVHFDNPKLTAHTGDIFDRLVDTYFVPPPSMMIRKSVLNELRGYDEQLSYEDFDFWIRSGFNWHYSFQNNILTKVRKISGSYSTNLYKKQDQQLASTLVVCRKIANMAKTVSSKNALYRRLHYEIKHAFVNGNTVELKGFIELMGSLCALPFYVRVMSLLSRIGVSFIWLKRLLQ